MLRGTLVAMACAAAVLGAWAGDVTLETVLQALLILGLACGVTACIYGLAEGR